MPQILGYTFFSGKSYALILTKSGKVDWATFGRFFTDLAGVYVMIPIFYDFCQFFAKFFGENIF
jgi:hypothetical protein